MMNNLKQSLYFILNGYMLPLLTVLRIVKKEEKI